MTARTRRLLLVLGAAVVAVSVALEIVIPAHHGPDWVEVWFHRVPGFHALVGFGGCWLIVKGSKLLGKLWLQRPEDYYGAPDDDLDAPPEPHGAAGEDPHGH